MSTLGDAADVNPVIKFLPHTCNLCGRNLIRGLTAAALPRVDISSTCKVGQKFGVSLPLLTCSTSAWPSRLLYCTQCNVCGRNLITGLTSAASPRLDISSTCKVGQKLGVSVPLLTCSPSAWPSGYCTAEVGNPGGTYELLCMSTYLEHPGISEYDFAEITIKGFIR